MAASHTRNKASLSRRVLAMSTMLYSQLLLTTMIFSVSTADHVKFWNADTEFENFKNWDKQEVPCKSSVVVFPADMKVPVSLTRSTSKSIWVEVSEVVLSREGSLLLPIDGGLTLTDEDDFATCSGGEVSADCVGTRVSPGRVSGVNQTGAIFPALQVFLFFILWLICERCITEGFEPLEPNEALGKAVLIARERIREIKFIRTERPKWTDPDNWNFENKTKAVPHLEGIPCVYDDAQFEGSFVLDLPERPVTVSSLTFNRVQMKYGPGWNYILFHKGSQVYSTLMGNADSLEISKAECDPLGCECGTSHLFDDVCQGKWRWQQADCANPVTPFGFCFPICGAFLLYKEGSISEISEAAYSVAKERNVASYTSRVKGYIQVVLVDENEYSERIEDIAKEVHLDLVHRGLVLGQSAKLSYSGLRVYRMTGSDVFKRFFSGLFFAMLIMAVIYCYYEIHWLRSVRLDDLISSWRRAGNDAGRFARFENVSGTVELGEEVVPSRVVPVPPIVKTDVGFDNPMFSQNLLSPEGVPLEERRGSVNSSDSGSECSVGTDSTTNDKLSMKEVNLELSDPQVDTKLK